MKRALGAVALIFLAFVLTGCESSSNASAPATPTQPAVTQNSDPMTDKSFHVESVSFKNNSLGMGWAVARIKNISNKAYFYTVFTITIFESDNVTVASTLTGITQGAQPGQTLTVQFMDDQPLPSVNFEYAFQTTAQY